MKSSLSWNKWWNQDPQTMPKKMKPQAQELKVKSRKYRDRVMHQMIPLLMRTRVWHNKREEALCEERG